jgi:hypothetical protein
MPLGKHGEQEKRSQANDLVAANIDNQTKYGANQKNCCCFRRCQGGIANRYVEIHAPEGKGVDEAIYECAAIHHDKLVVMRY